MEVLSRHLTSEFHHEIITELQITKILFLRLLPRFVQLQLIRCVTLFTVIFINDVDIRWALCHLVKSLHPVNYLCTFVEGFVSRLPIIICLPPVGKFDLDHIP